MSKHTRARGWPGDLFRRLTFERGTRTIYPTLHGRPHRGGFRYDVDVRLPLLDVQRHVVITFSSRSAVPLVFVDGPSESPHRYDDGSLCMWFPEDPPSQRWCFDDGLLDLVDLTVDHLLREELWRRLGAWIGPEVPHAAGAEFGEVTS